jgi:hypothetical protein
MTPPELGDVQTLEDFAACLDALRAGRSYQAMQNAARRLPEGQREGLPTSTVSEILKGQRMPSRERLETFLAVCGVPDDGRRQPWRAAWERAKANQKVRPAGAVRVAEALPRELGVHPSIRVPDQNGDQPPYVERDHDAELRQTLAGCGRGGGFVLLIGESSVGKTRSLLEALRSVSPNRWLIQPADVAEICALAADPPRGSVLWLDDLQRYLNGERGVDAVTLRGLIRAGVLIVGTVWPDDYQAASTLYRPGPDDPRARVREALALAQTVDVPRRLTAAERDRTAELAAHDLRLRIALGDADLGVTQVLAAGPALVRWWEQSTDAYGAAVISAAADARRLGVTGPLGREFLADAAVGYLSSAHRATAPADWLDRALGYATTPLHGAASALAPVDGGAIGTVAGYVIADYLLQRARATRRTTSPPVRIWQALLEHVDDTDALTRIADQAERRMRYHTAEQVYGILAGRGSLYAVIRLVLLLSWQGRGEEIRAQVHQFREQATTSAGHMGWTLFVGLLTYYRTVDDALREGRWRDAIDLEHATTAPDFRSPTIDSIRSLAAGGDADRLREYADRGDEHAAMWLAALAAEQNRVRDLLDEVNAGTPLAGRMYQLVIERTDQAQRGKVRRYGLEPPSGR